MLKTFSSLASCLDFNAFPKRDSAGDAFRSRFRIGIVPGSVSILLAINYQVVILRDALPWATRFVATRLDKILTDILYREVVISFHDLGSTGFCDYFSVP
jgi:hypothetical protein